MKRAKQSPYKVIHAPDGDKNKYLTVETLETWFNENDAAGFEYIGMLTKHFGSGGAMWVQDFCVFRRKRSSR